MQELCKDFLYFKKKQLIVFSLIFIILIRLSYSNNYNDPITYSMGDLRWCRLNAECTLASLTVHNLSVIGAYFNVTVTDIYMNVTHLQGIENYATHSNLRENITEILTNGTLQLKLTNSSNITCVGNQCYYNGTVNYYTKADTNLTIDTKITNYSNSNPKGFITNNTNINENKGNFSNLSTDSITNRNLTLGRIPYASIGGLVADSSGLIFNSSTSALTTGIITAGIPISITNHNFSDGLNGWDTDGGAWYDDGDSAYTETVNKVLQPNPDLTIQIGHTYTLIFSGYLDYDTGGMTVSCGGQSTVFSGTSTFTWTFTATSTANLKFNSGGCNYVWIYDVALTEGGVINTQTLSANGIISSGVASPLYAIDIKAPLSGIADPIDYGIRIDMRDSTFSVNEQLGTTLAVSFLPKAGTYVATNFFFGTTMSYLGYQQWRFGAGAGGGTWQRDGIRFMDDTEYADAMGVASYYSGYPGLVIPSGYAGEQARISFRDINNNVYIISNDVGHLDLNALTAVDLNTPIVNAAGKLNVSTNLTIGTWTVGVIGNNLTFFNSSGAEVRKMLQNGSLCFPNGGCV